jgi:hypothetical protein
MAKNPQQTSSASGGSFDKSLNEDNQGFAKSPQEWTQARNAVNNTVAGDIYQLSNESSNYLCSQVPESYSIIGTIHVSGDKWAIYSTDNTSSEIGIFTEDNCTYTTLVNDDCLNFNTKHLITGASKENFDCSRHLYWADGLNPDRHLNIDDIPWKTEQVAESGNPDCITDQPSQPLELDCDRLRLEPIVDNLAFEIKEGTTSGELLNGSYYVAGAYLQNGVRVTDFSLPSNVVGLWKHDNVGSSLEIEVTKTDVDYDEFQLVLLQFANFQGPLAYIVGTYTTDQTKITITSLNTKWAQLPEGEGALIRRNPIADKSDAMYKAADYLMRVGPTDKFDFNYQPLANQIKSKWVSVEYDTEYYKNGGYNTGYMRDEVYPFFIRWVFNTGDKSASYHIPGRESTITDTDNAGSNNLIEGESNGLKKWEVYNTATIDAPFTPYDLPDGGRVIGQGNMSYWQSTEEYPGDKPDVWAELCGKKIRHHKFPDNASDTGSNMVTNHYDPADGSKIRIMGVQFYNIQVPVDNNGDTIENIVGYELLRGSREGNKTVFAKGMINNMREYWVDNDIGNPVDGTIPPRVEDLDGRRKLYANYPFNPVGEERYLSQTETVNQSGANDTDPSAGGNDEEEQSAPYYLDTDNPYSEAFVRKDYFTFHSPETNFKDPYLSAKELKIYGELNGTATGSFEFPAGHPKHKFIGNTAFFTSVFLGIGIALTKAFGKRSVRTNAVTSPLVGGLAGTFPGAFSTYLGYSPSAASSISLNATTALLKSVYNEAGIFSVLGGISPNIFLDAGLLTVKSIGTGAGADGGGTSEEREVSDWDMLPSYFKILVGLPSFILNLGEGIQQWIDIFYAFTPYRQYALQYAAHCFYDRFQAPDELNIRRSINASNYLDNQLQDFNPEYRINNIYRPRTVALNIGEDLKHPVLVDNTQKTLSEAFTEQGTTSIADSKIWNRFVGRSFNTDASSHYVALKQPFKNQYGQISDIIQLPVSTKVTQETQVKSDVMFNGDTYIGRYTEKNTMFFFYDWLNGQPDGAEFDYRNYYMVANPRFWMDTDQFDVNEFVTSLSSIFNSEADSNSEGFNFFQTVTDSNGTPVSPECGCTAPAVINSNSCYLLSTGANGLNCSDIDAADLQELCDLEEELAQAQNYLNWLQEWLDHQTELCGNEDNGNLLSGLTPPALPSVADCPECNDIQSGSNPITSYYDEANANGWKLDDTDCEPKAKWNRKLRQAAKDVEKAGDKLYKEQNRIYDLYLECAKGTEDGSWLDFSEVALPSRKYAFDRRKSSIFSMGVRNAFMYLFNSGVRDFFVESEINLDYRDYGAKIEEQHYDAYRFSDLRQMFHTDIIKSGNFYNYDYSLSISKLFTGFTSWGNVQQRNYDPAIAESCYIYRPNRILYSLPRQDENKADFWRAYLANNYEDFGSRPTTIKTVGANGIMIFFNGEGPIQFRGVDQLQLDGGTTVVLGTGGLFEQPRQQLTNADDPYEYGSCQDGLSVINTPVGVFYISQRQGKIFQAGAQGLTEISNLGLKWWFSKYLPYKLTDDFPEFDIIDNPVQGIGCQTIFDNENQIVYFCKKDYIPVESKKNGLSYDTDEQKFFYLSPSNTRIEVQLSDPNYFIDASWTASFDPKFNVWVSYHDWHPDLVIPSRKTFMTTKDNGIWVHNDSCNDYCNFYGDYYPFEIEFAIHNKTEVFTLRNIVYYMEAYRYDQNCDDRFHILDENFDEAIVFNSEQCSGLLKLNIAPKNEPGQLITYPQVNANFIDIVFHKEEQKYRFNQFWDITRDRGEFNPAATQTIFDTQANGYVKILNPAYLNYDKSSFERKKFRHLKNSVLLRKNFNDNNKDVNMIMSLALQMNLKSSR